MIYNRLSVLRAEAGLSRQELADSVEVNYQTIGFIERGDYLPSLELAFKIARVFDVDISVVFSDEQFKPLLTSVKGRRHEESKK
jgi:DNA-binding XRE family transcriptional regulator